MKIKKSQKLQIRFYNIGATSVAVRCKYQALADVLDLQSVGAVEQALAAILQEPCRGISATFNNKTIQVDLLD